MRPMPNPKRLTDALSLTFNRKPQPYGFEVYRLKYNSPLVAALRAMPNRPSTFQLAVDPNDLTRISVLDPRDNRFHEVPVVPGQLALTRGTSLHQHRMAVALQESNPDAFAGDDGLARAHTVIDRAMEQKIAAKGLKNRTEAARYWDALMRAKPPEEPPAFDIKVSANPITAGLFGDASAETPDEDADEPAVAPEVPEVKAQEVVVATPEGSREPAAAPRARRPRKPKEAPPAAEQALPGNGDDESLVAFARQLGVKVHKLGDTTDER